MNLHNFGVLKSNFPFFSPSKSHKTPIIRKSSIITPLNEHDKTSIAGQSNINTNIQIIEISIKLQCDLTKKPFMSPSKTINLMNNKFVFIETSFFLFHNSPPVIKMCAKLPFMVIFDKNPRNYLQIIISRVQLLEREHLSITQSKFLYHENNKVVAKSDKTHHEVVG
jgi:hypothetical protein